MSTRQNRPRSVRLTCVFTVAFLSIYGSLAAGEGLKTPKLLVTLPDTCPTPDGMALDAEGNVILACPNFADQTKPAVLMKITPDNRVEEFFHVRPHPKTGVACPMGIAFGPSGDLYVADNQGWVKPNNLGRLLRIKFRDGKPVGHTVMAHGMSHPNGVRVRGDCVYVTQSLLVKEGDEPLISGVYRFKLDDKGIRVNNALDDPNLLVTIKTLNADCQYGADGLVFDGKGNLYIGNFGDATIHKITFDEQGNVASNTRFAQADCMKSTDGICIDTNDNIYVADFSNNTVCVVDPQGNVRVLAQSPDCDGSGGGLDQPGDPLIRGRDLIVSCFDMVTGPDKVNSGHDAPYTISVISLDEPTIQDERDGD